MAAPAPAPLRYLDGDDVRAAMPDLPERLRLAERTLRALVADADLPPKIGVHPRPPGSFAHAMPALLRGADPDGRDDRLGMKWVLGFGGNAARGLPSIHGLLLLNDPQTGVPTAVLDAGPITAERTAAVSGVAIRAWAPPVSGRAPVVAIVGAGTQARSHLPVVGHVLRGVRVVLFDRHPERAEAVADAARDTPGITGAEIAPTPRDAVAGADVVITVASFTSPDRRQVMTGDWLGPEALVVPVDYATYCSAEVARSAAMFLVDDRQQFLANRDAGNFDDYPDPSAMIGEALIAGTARPRGRVVATHLGVGLADVVFGDAIVAAAAERGLGTLLRR